MENLDIVERTDRLVARIDNLHHKPACSFNDPEELREALETAMEQAEVAIDDCERRLNKLEECGALLSHAIEQLDAHVEEGGC